MYYQYVYVNDLWNHQRQGNATYSNYFKSTFSKKSMIASLQKVTR